jgi:putative transposase
LRCQAAEKSDTAWVQAIFEAAFREYGLPEAIRTDNGAPFASPAVAGLSRLAVWWINRRSQQRALDRFRQEYNELRPHEALQMRTPAAVYAPSARKFPSRVPEPEYPASMLDAQCAATWSFSVEEGRWFLSEVLWGEPVGLLADDERWYTVYFAQLPIARFDSQQLCVRSLPKSRGFCKVSAGEGVASPSPAPHSLTAEEQKVSGMRPV